MPHRACLLRMTGWLSVACIAVMVLLQAGCGGMSNSAASPGSQNAAQQSQISTAVNSGYVWETASSPAALRPIVGLPGGAQFGGPSYNSGAYTSGVAASRLGYVLLTGSDGAISLANLPSGQPKIVAPGISPAEQVVISPTGVTAAVFAPGQTAELLLNLASAPQTQSIAVPAGTFALAVSDAGYLLAAVPQASSGVAISVISPQGATQGLIHLGKLGDMRFVGMSNGALLADSAKNVVWWTPDATTGASPQSIATAANGVKAPSGVAASYDGRWAVIANPNGTILRVNLSQAAPVIAANCSCVPDRLAPLTGNANFQITAAGSGPMWLYQGDLPTPRTVFVPAILHSGTVIQAAVKSGK
jgi:hypothetical protein